MIGCERRYLKHMSWASVYLEGYRMISGFKCVPVLVVLGFWGDHVEGKHQIDVSIPLAEKVCDATKGFVESMKLQGDLKDKPGDIKPPEDGVCYIWRWTRCEYTHKEPCGTWEKTLCRGQEGEDGGPKGHCDIYQCGWTLDEIYSNWGYNPEHVHPMQKPLHPTMNITDTGSTIDFPKMMSQNEL